MKKWIFLGALALFSSAAVGQAPVSPERKQLEDLVKSVQAQQDQIALNQAAIDAKLATLAETIRVSRIYSSRGGR